MSRIPFFQSYQDQKIVFKVKPSTKNLKKIEISNSRVPYNEETKLIYESFFYKNKYPYRNSDFNTIPNKYQYQFRKFCIALDAFEETRSQSTLSTHEIIKIYSRGPLGLEEYKKYRLRNFVENICGTWRQVPDDLQIQKTRIFKIGDIFNYNYGFRWVEPIPEDYKFMYSDYDEIDHDNLELFRQSVRKILPKQIKKVFREEILLKSSTSVSINPQSGEKQPNWMTKQNMFSYDFASKMGICKRSVIDVSVSNIRDSIICKTDVLNTVMLIDKVVFEIVKQFKQFPQLEKSSFEKQYKRFQMKNQFFYCRDIEKDGLTKPKVLLKVMLEEINEKYKLDLPSNFYDSFQIEIEGQLQKWSPRGHGLGMANNLTTLMQLAILKIIEDQGAEFDSLVFNDDIIVGFQDEESLEQFMEIESGVAQSLQIMIKKTKSFHAEKAGIFCEEYFGIDPQKDSYYEYISYLPLICHNIVQAKFLTRSLIQYISQKKLQEIIDYWGYEFFPEESNLPAVFGGWYSRSVKGYKMDLIDCDINQIQNLKAFESEQNSYVKKISEKSLNRNQYKSPLQLLFGIDDPYLEKMNISQLEEKFTQLSRDASKLMSYWNRLYKKRQVQFQLAKSKPLDNYIQDLIQKDQYIIPKQFWKEQILVQTEQFKYVDDFYDHSHPQLSYASFHQKFSDDEIVPEQFSIDFEKIKQVENVFKNLNVDVLRYNTFRPKNYASAYREAFGTFQVPIFQIDMSKKTSIFGFIPDQMLIYRLKRLKIDYPIFYRICLSLNKNEDEIIKFVDYVEQSIKDKQLDLALQQESDKSSIELEAELQKSVEFKSIESDEIYQSEEEEQEENSSSRDSREYICEDSDEYDNYASQDEDDD